MTIPPPTARATVAVVIPSWNGRAMLDLVLGSLERQTVAPAVTIVVDNGSTDGTVGHLAERWPAVRVVALPSNRGFAAAVNAGIAAAEPLDVALLNNDVELEPDWLERLLAAVAADPLAGSFAAKLRMFGERDVLDGAGDLVTWYGAVWRRGHGEVDRGQYDLAGPTVSACAGAALYRRAALVDVGPFDESFFAYLEDTDWGIRAALAGWRCAWVPDAVAYHVGGATSRRMGDLEAELIARNTVALVLKNLPWRKIAAYGPLIVAYQAYALLAAARHGRLRASLRGTLAGVRRIPATLAARRRVVRRAPLDPVMPSGILRRAATRQDR